MKIYHIVHLYTQKYLLKWEKGNEKRWTCLKKMTYGINECFEELINNLFQ